MNRRRLIAAAALAPLCAGCAHPSVPARVEIPEPGLRLPPSLLGREFAMQQRLRVSAAGRELVLQALLEADAAGLRLALFAFERRVARLEWDGASLTLQTGPDWPPAVSAERMLSDLTLTLWPADAVSAALSGDWSLAADASRRELRWRDRTAVRVRYHGSDRWVIENPVRDYRIEVDSFAIPE